MKTTINLLPKKSPEEQHEKRRQRLVLASIAGAFLLLLLLWGVLFIQKERLANLEKNLLADVSQKEENIKNLSEEERLYRNVYNKSAAARMLMRGGETFLKNMQSVRNYINSGVSIKDIAIDREGLSLTVVATDIGSINEYISELENENHRAAVFKKLTLSSVTIDKATGYAVTIQGTFVP